jgi:hypothetical protein
MALEITAEARPLPLGLKAQPRHFWHENALKLLWFEPSPGAR